LKAFFSVAAPCADRVGAGVACAGEAPTAPTTAADVSMAMVTRRGRGSGTGLDFMVTLP
jgi:hypothetical protein